MAASPPLPPSGNPPTPDASGETAARWERVHELFQEALDLDPESRARLLAERSIPDPALVEEVRSLLDAHAESSGFLGSPPGPPPVGTAWAGDKIGPYRIVEEIGRGGMGLVYRATRDDDVFHKEVAVKLIDPGMRSDQVLRRFRAERQILAMLEHPHIARLIDGGTAVDGSPYLVMEYVDGEPLLDWCDERHLGVDERLRLFLAVCDAVQFAHQRLVVHRDLKSDNILVGADGSPRLLDFGIAKLLSPEGGPAGTVTAPIHRMLTPDYASPEQIRGEPATVAGDVYSLGVILYELLSGGRPHRFQTRSPEEILRVITQVDPPAPSTVAARSPEGEAARRRGDTTARLRRRLAGDLDFVTLKALEKDPARRYRSVDQLADDVRRHLQGLPVLARGRSTTYLVSRFVRRHRAAVVTTAVVVLSLLAGLLGTAWQADVASRERDRAKRRFDEVRSLAHAVVFDIHDAIANLPGSTRAREILVQHALDYLDRLSREAKGDLSLQRELAVAYAKIGDVQGRPMFPNLGQSGPALASYEKSLRLMADIARAMPESTSIVHEQVMVSQRRSDLLKIMGHPREALREALDQKQRIMDQLARHPGDVAFITDLCVTYGRLEEMLYQSGDTLRAIEECRAYVTLVDSLFQGSPTDPSVRRGAIISSEKMAELFGWRGQTDSASTYYVRAERLAIQSAAAQPNNTDASRDLSIVYGAHGLFLSQCGLVDSALAVYQRGQDIAERLAAQDPENALPLADVAAGNYDLGTILMKGRRYAAAEQSFRRAWEGFGRLAEADTSNAENRLYMARSGREAGRACDARAAEAGSKAERSRWSGEARSWWRKSLDVYRALAAAGSLTGEETAAPAELDRLVAQRAP